jgi:hypothetical protein
MQTRVFARLLAMYTDVHLIRTAMGLRTIRLLTGAAVPRARSVQLASADDRPVIGLCAQ